MKGPWVLALGAVLAACGAHHASTKAVDHAAPPPSVDAGAKVDDQSLRVRPIITLTERAVGPYLSYSTSGAMVAYVGGKAGARAVFTIPLDSAGSVRSPARPVANVATDASSLVLRKLGDGGARRYALAWTALSDKGESLSVATVDADGNVTGGPSLVTQTNDDVVWTEIVETERGAVCVWAEQTRAGEANLLAVGLDEKGKLNGVPGAVARGVVGWQAVRAGAGVGVATLTPTKKTDAKAPAVGALGFVKLDAAGHAQGDAAIIASGDVVGSDFDVARVGDLGFVFSWTDRTGIDPEIALASLDSHGVVRGPGKVDARRGGHELVGLSGSPEGALLVFEDARKREVPERRLTSGLVRRPDDLAGVELSSTVLDVHAPGAPELRASRPGFAWLALGRACTGEPCADAPTKSLFLRFDGGLKPADVEPLGDGAAWSLDCDGDHCAALTATGEPETRVSFIDLPKHDPRALAPLSRVPRGAIQSLSTLSARASVSDVAVVRSGSALLLASLAHDEAGKEDTETLTVRALTAGADPESHVLTRRALAIGNVAMAEDDRGAVVAWVSKDADPAVYLAKVDAHGKKTKDTRLTSTPGAKSDVAIARISGGFVVAWVDGRDGNGEVYATRVTAELTRDGRDERITRAPGDATDLVVIASGDHVVAAWADPRESPSDGFADVYTTVLGKSGKPAGTDVRVLATSAHSRSPALASDGKGLTLAWIEEAPASASPKAETYGAMIATLDASGKPMGDAGRLKLPTSGLATSIAFDATSPVPRGILAVSTPAEMTLSLFLAAPSPSFTTLVALDGPPSVDVPLAIAGRDLVFGDDGPDQDDARLRYAVLDPKLAGGAP